MPCLNCTGLMYSLRNFLRSSLIRWLVSASLFRSTFRFSGGSGILNLQEDWTHQTITWNNLTLLDLRIKKIGNYSQNCYCMRMCTVYILQVKNKTSTYTCKTDVLILFCIYTYTWKLYWQENILHFS